MKGNSIKDFSFGTNYSFIEDNLSKETFCRQEGFSMVSRLPYKDNESLIFNQPYRLEEGRIVRILDGYVRYIIELQPLSLRKGDVLFLMPGCVIEMDKISSDCNLQILAFNRDVQYIDAHQPMHISPNEEEWQQMTILIQLIWKVLHHQPVRSLQLGYLYAALYSQILSLHNESVIESDTTHSNRKQQLFQQFVSLIREYCVEYRTITHYANLLCITPHYLSALVKEVSGESVMQWVNRAIIVEAKLRLRQNSLSIVQVSDELNFPNPAFFNKFFKREVGITPGQYKKQR